MSEKKQGTFFKTIINLAMTFSGLFGLVNTAIKIIKYELHVAGKNIGYILFLGLVLLCLLLSAWLCIQGLLFLYFISLPLRPTLSVAIILAINILLLIVTLIAITKCKKHLLFPNTRRLLYAGKNLLKNNK